MKKKEKIEQQDGVPQTVALSQKSIIIGVLIVLVLLIASTIMAYTLPTGRYPTITDDKGNISIDTTKDFEYDSSLPRIAWWKVILSPVMILDPTQQGSAMIWSILILLFVLGAIFTALDKTGILLYMVESLRYKFGNKKYILIFLMPLIFMFLGSSSGMFEEIVPIAPVIILLSYAFGWDALVGLGMSILGACFGGAAGIVNPFNIGVAQSLLGIPVFSGIEVRILTFVLGYIVIVSFLYPYAKKIEKCPSKSIVYQEDLAKKKLYNFENQEFICDKQKDKALKWVGCWLIAVVVIAFISVFIQPRFIPSLGDFSLADYVLYITVAIYLIAGVGACIFCGQKGKELLKNLASGALTLAPAVAMILIAGGIRYIIQEGNVMDTILYNVINLCEGKSPAAIIMLIYMAIFILEIFIPSGSAKAFLLMPLIGTMCARLGVNPQVAVLAFAFADGFSNLLFPTNAALILLLGMTTVSYPKWVRWSLKIQLVMFLVTVGILMMGQYCNIFL